MNKKLALSFMLLSSMNTTYSSDAVGTIKKECSNVFNMGLNAVMATPSLEEIIIEAPVAWEINKSKSSETDKFKKTVKSIIKFMIASTVARKIMQLPLQSSYIWNPVNYFKDTWGLQGSVRYLNSIKDEPCTTKFFSQKIGYGTLCGVITLYRMRVLLTVLHPLIKRASQMYKENQAANEAYEKIEKDKLAHLKEVTTSAA